MDDISVLVGMAIGFGIFTLGAILLYLGVFSAAWYNRRKRSSK